MIPNVPRRPRDSLTVTQDAIACTGPVICPDSLPIGDYRPVADQVYWFETGWLNLPRLASPSSLLKSARFI